MLRQWIIDAVTEIVELYSINPTTLYGTMNIGIDVKMYPGLKKFDKEQIDEFNDAYKEFGVNAYHMLGIRLAPMISKAINLGYSDIFCSVTNFVKGALVLEVLAISKISDEL